MLGAVVVVGNRFFGFPQMIDDGLSDPPWSRPERTYVEIALAGGDRKLLADPPPVAGVARGGPSFLSERGAPRRCSFHERPQTEAGRRTKKITALHAFIFSRGAAGVGVATHCARSVSPPASGGTNGPVAYSMWSRGALAPPAALNENADRVPVPVTTNTIALPLAH